MELRPAPTSSSYHQDYSDNTYSMARDIYMVLTAEQLPVPEQHARARASRASNTLHADQISKGYTAQQACCAVSRSILSMPAAADSLITDHPVGWPPRWATLWAPLLGGVRGSHCEASRLGLNRHTDLIYTQTQLSPTRIYSAQSHSDTHSAWTDEKASKKAAKTAANTAKRARFTRLGGCVKGRS
jgi:hypothetical protein